MLNARKMGKARAVSIAGNTAGDTGRETVRELIRYLYIAKGSAAELKTQLQVAMTAGVIIVAF